MTAHFSTFSTRFPDNSGGNYDIALFKPDIPLNVGSIARTCACTGMPLHLVGTLGFFLDGKLARRAGLDYWEHVDLRVHKTWDEFRKSVADRRLWLFSTKGTKVFWEVEYREGDVLVFGPERTGLPKNILESDTGNIVVIPMLKERRSLNLANAVSIVAYEVLRQRFARGREGQSG